MFGIAGYLSFGPDTKEIITLNLEPEGGIDFALIVKVCLCFSLFFTYPVMMFPVTKIITPKVQQFITIEVSSHSNTKSRHSGLICSDEGQLGHFPLC